MIDWWHGCLTNANDRTGISGIHAALFMITFECGRRKALLLWTFFEPVWGLSMAAVEGSWSAFDGWPSIQRRPSTPHFLQIERFEISTNLPQHDKSAPLSTLDEAASLHSRSSRSAGSSYSSPMFEILVPSLGCSGPQGGRVYSCRGRFDPLLIHVRRK
jgi:hypothetical protein